MSSHVSLFTTDTNLNAWEKRGHQTADQTKSSALYARVHRGAWTYQQCSHYAEQPYSELLFCITVRSMYDMHTVPVVLYMGVSVSEQQAPIFALWGRHTRIKWNTAQIIHQRRALCISDAACKLAFFTVEFYRFSQKEMKGAERIVQMCSCVRVVYEK